VPVVPVVDTRSMHIERVTQVDDALVAAFARLLPQLSLPGPQAAHPPQLGLPGPQAAHPPDRAHLEAMVGDPRSFLLLARDPDVVGTLTLTVFPLPTGLSAQINAVVVDEAARGRGIGEALTHEAVRLARAAGVYRVMLTSRDTRKAAHRMYLRAGFEQLGSHVFRLLL
jgi:ribosomal protein S18 acetylase RimI-like enzyme